MINLLRHTGDLGRAKNKSMILGNKSHTASMHLRVVTDGLPENNQPEQARNVSNRGNE